MEFFLNLIALLHRMSSKLSCGWEALRQLGAGTGRVLPWLGCVLPRPDPNFQFPFTTWHTPCGSFTEYVDHRGANTC